MLYIAIEFNEDGTVNDEGRVAYSPEAAWEMVEHVFSAPCTTIYCLGQKISYKPVAQGYKIIRNTEL